MTFAGRNIAAVVIVSLYLAQPFAAHAITTDELIQEIFGAPVYASDGHEIGEVADVSVSEDGEIDAVRVKTGAFLGFGEHVLALSRGAFTVLRGAVVLDLPAEAIETLRPCRPTDSPHRWRSEPLHVCPLAFGDLPQTFVQGQIVERSER